MNFPHPTLSLAIDLTRLKALTRVDLTWVESLTRLEWIIDLTRVKTLTRSESEMTRLVTRPVCTIKAKMSHGCLVTTLSMN